MQPTISEVLEQAQEYTRRHAKPTGKISLDPMLASSPSVVKAIDGLMAELGRSREDAEDAIMRAQNCGDLLTHEELAARLKVPASWVREKTLKRCHNPIPSIPMGRYIRFDWDAVVKWLEIQAEERSAERSRK